MRKVIIIAAVLVCVCASTTDAKDKPKMTLLGYPLTPVQISDVKLDDGFWAERMKLHTEVTIPHILKTLNVDYDDPMPGKSALALSRTLEGAAFCLMIEDDPKTDKMMEKISNAIGQTIKDGKRWWGTKPESAAYYYLATGKNTAHLEEGKKEYQLRRKEYFDDNWKPIKEPLPHAFIEMASTSLYRATGDEFYKRLTQAFMDSRGMPATKKRLWPKFAAQHQPIEKMNEPGGHAGSFGWFAPGLVDVGVMTGEKKYLDAAIRIWQNMVDTRMCITGGTGAVGKWEGFGKEYAIGLGGYNETCAASGQVFYNQRLGWVTKEGKYFDMMEVALFNGFLGGGSLDGDKFFYCNGLNGGGGRALDRRVPCCHGSFARTVPQVPWYMYAHTDDEIYVTLYAANSTAIALKDGEVGLKQETKYPFDGKITLEVTPGKKGQEFAIKLRIPTWAQDKFIPGALYSYVEAPPESWTVQVNGEPVKAKLKDGFIAIDREWKKGDKVQLDLPMPIQFSSSTDKIVAYKDRLTVTRGPLVYCAEKVDNDSRASLLGKLPKQDQVKLSTIKKGLLDGLTMITFPSVEVVDGAEKTVDINLIPYYARANREPRGWATWIPKAAK